MEGCKIWKQNSILHLPATKKLTLIFAVLPSIPIQPAEDGGNNTAPSPLELFLVSVGMCAGFYVLSFCQSRSIPMDNISITQTVVRNDQTHNVEKVMIDINLSPDFPEKYKAAVIKAAQSCSVKKFLDAPPEIQINTKM